MDQPWKPPERSGAMEHQQVSALPRPRSRRLKRREVSFAVNIAPMIDVTFLLLIFFLVTTTFDPPEGLLASRLPRDTDRPGVALPISPVVLRLTQTGPEAGDFTIRVDHVETLPANFEELADLLAGIQEQPGFDEETPVVIIAGPEVKWDHVVNAWNAAVRCEYENIAFGNP